MLKSLVSKLIFSIFKPEKKRSGNRPIREILKLPIFFDLSSFFIQLRYLHRIKYVDSLSKTSKYLKDVLDYNYTVTSSKLITRSRRAEVYYQISSIILNEISNKKLLIIGPRNVQELFIAWLYGFNWENIFAIDLYNSHPKIKIMDMHNLDIKDEIFDCVVMANTLAYADDTRKVIQEVSRVLKPDGIFTFGATFEPMDKRWGGSIINGENIYKFLKDSKMNINLHLPEEKVNSSGRSQTTHNFCAKKINSSFELTDNFSI
tara:strand:+ start:325 stop:1107 length:783 start_codon:yes stop_codon:yes gene_type:complete